MVDRTVYPDKDKVPELALRQIFGRQKLPESLCLLMADKGMLLVERMAMLGDSIASVKATLKAIVGDDTKFGADAPAQELSLTLLTAVWKSASVLQEHISARRAKMEEDPSKIPEIPGEDHAEFREIFVTQHPDMILTYMREPHRKFVERIHRDYLVHGAVAFYEVAEMRTRADRIVQTSGFSKTSDDLLRVVQSDNKVAIASDSDVMDRLHAFFIALEYLNICDFTIAAGPLKYLSELEEWRHENRGLAVLLAADSLIRKKVYKLNNDKRKEFPSFSLALLEALTHHINNSGTMLDLQPSLRNFAKLITKRQRQPRGLARDPHPWSLRRLRARRARARTRLAASATKLCSRRLARIATRREREKQISKGSSTVKLTEKTERDQRVPEKEWKKIMSFTYTGARRCPFYNCSLGCRFGDQCRNKHICVQCGGDHPWHNNH